MRFFLVTVAALAASCAAFTSVPSLVNSKPAFLSSSSSSPLVGTPTQNLERCESKLGMSAVAEESETKVSTDIR